LHGHALGLWLLFVLVVLRSYLTNGGSIGGRWFLVRLLLGLRWNNRLLLLLLLLRK